MYGTKSTIEVTADYVIKKSNDKDLAVPELNNEIKVLKFLEEKKFNLCASLIAYERGLFIKLNVCAGR